MKSTLNDLLDALKRNRGYAFRLTGKRHDAEDLAQDTFLKVHKAGIPEDVQSLDAYIKTIMRNTWIDGLRTTHLPNCGRIDQMGTLLEVLLSLDDNATRREESPSPVVKELDALIERLPTKLREFAYLALDVGCDNDRIFDELASSVRDEKSRRQLLKKIRRNWQRLQVEVPKLLCDDRCVVTRILEWAHGGHWNGCGSPSAYASDIDAALQNHPEIEMCVYGQNLTSWLLTKGLREKSHQVRIQNAELVDGANQLSARNFRARNQRRQDGNPCFFTVLVPECHLDDLRDREGQYRDCSRDDIKEFRDSIDEDFRSGHLRVLKIPTAAMKMFAKRTRTLDTVGLYRVGEDRKTHMIAVRDAAFGVRWFKPCRKQHWEESLIAAMEKRSQEVDLVQTLRP